MLNKQVNQHIKLSLLTLLIYASFASFGAVLPTPALPDIASYFKLSHGVEWVMSIYLIGYALGQLLYGPIANHFGRKRALLSGALLALIGICLQFAATSVKLYPLYLIGRLVFALGAASGLVIAMIMIKDTYQGAQANKAFSKVILTFAFVPCIAMALSGWLTSHFSWLSTNYVLLAYLVLIFVNLILTPETIRQEHYMRISVKNISQSYRKIFNNRNFLIYLCVFMAAGSISYLFNSLTPLIAIKTLHISAQTYGWLSFFPCLGMALGGWISSRYLTKLSIQRVIQSSLLLIVLSSFIGLALFILGALNLYTLFIPGSLIFIGLAILIPNASMEALSTLKDHSNGSSLLNAIGITGCSLFVALFGSLISLGSFILPASILLLSIIALVIISLKPTKHSEATWHHSQSDLP